MPVSTTSRWPCSTRRATSRSTSSARRLRDAPRTSGITQKLQEKLQPSCTFTNARTRSSRASARTQPIGPTSRATRPGVCSGVPAMTDTFAGTVARASPARLAAQPVTYTRLCVRAARAAACRDFATASFVTQQPLMTAMSAASPSSSCPSASSRARRPCASACETLQPRNRTEKVAMGSANLLSFEEIGGPAAVDSPLAVGEAGDRRHPRVEVARADEDVGVDPPAQLVDRPEVDVRNRDVARGENGREDVRTANVDVDAVRTRVPPRGLDRRRFAVDRDHRREPQPRGGNREHARAAADVEQAAAAELHEQLEAQPGGRVRAGAEGAAGVDDDGDDSGRRLLPGRPDPERADPDRAVKLPPALLPPGLHRFGGDVAERRAKPLLARPVGVDDEGALFLLEALGMKLEQLRPGDLDRVGGDRDADPPKLAPRQRKALLSLSKNPSSAR